MKRASNPTLRDVAIKAGVSLTTVSYVLSGRNTGTTRISQPTHARVLAAAADLGYVPNQAARGMRLGRTEMVAVAIGDLEWAPDRALATAAAAILPKHGYQAVIMLGQAWRQFMLSGGADGIIVGDIPPHASEDSTITELARRGVAQVVISAAMQPAGFDVLVPGVVDPASPAAGADSIPELAVHMLVERLVGNAPADGVRVAVPRRLTLRGTSLDAYRESPSAVGSFSWIDRT
ncbi:LacI family DNA-binding transcriptional regulator [Arthrobacter sp. ISL-28]|uniref:LacI family DNA-binding transcriptional regulator n=1 Tax=Arthrobacter sp. ISL-28 TaxID=2819108 RepID=UPI001BE6A1CE|nr:LacI family DNA-binding transcriptional regulator [Arthrobacter sp. ISL-28]MBT2521953.1 LacI family DNA-binding transcriptional regulator [Arthrobacter sp. ISL-28]